MLCTWMTSWLVRPISTWKKALMTAVDAGVVAVHSLKVLAPYPVRS